MPQTMMALLALMMFSLFTLQQQRSTLRAQMTMVRNAVETIANGVATERLEEIGSKAFDQQSTDESEVDAPSDLTAEASFGTGQDQPGDDIDDFHNTTKDIYRVVGGDTLTFRVEAQVSYADESSPDTEVDYPTKYKKVTVLVSSEDVDITGGEIQISQSHSCKSACTW